MRALLAVILIVVLGSCRFDVSGTAGSGGDDDDQQDGGTSTIDGADVPDGTSIPAPIDAGPGNPEVQCGDQVCGGSTICCADFSGDTCTAPDACGGTAVTCDGASDCPGQECCTYAGGLWVGCADSCLGGDTLCGGPSDCASNETCCSSLSGFDTCQQFCF